MYLLTIPALAIGLVGGLIARRVYRDIRSVDGVLLAFEEERQLEGQTVMQVFVTKLTINTNVPEEEFKRPASAPTEPAKH